MAKNKRTKAEYNLKKLKDYLEWNDKEYKRLLEMKEDISQRMKTLLDEHAETSAEIRELEK